VLVPDRTRIQCCNRWQDVLDPSNDRANGCTVKWSKDEDSKLKDGVHTHGGKNWVAIAALVPGRTRIQCSSRWHSILAPDRANVRCAWAEDEDSKLKDAVQRHGGENWAAISALVPGRTKRQCYNRWHNSLDQSIDRATGRSGQWFEDEDSKLKDAVRTHGGKNWAAVAALVPGRTRNQCSARWHWSSKYSIDRANGQ
jgi:hypothetical protein